MDKYINQKEIDELSEAIQKINPDLRLGQFGIDTKENKILSCGLTIYEKGNKETIKQLQALGFRIVLRRKDNVSWRDNYVGYKFKVTLSKYLGGE